MTLYEIDKQISHDSEILEKIKDIIYRSKNNMSRIELFENSANDITNVKKNKYSPSDEYKNIIDKTNKRIEEYYHRLDSVYEKASRFFVR